MIESKFWQDESANKITKWQPGLSTTILLLLTGVALLTSLLSALINQDAAETWWSGFLQNFSTEMMGAIITFGLFELILNRRKEIDEKTSLETRQKRRLKILAGSRSNLVALQALDELRAEGWLELLQDEDISLENANLAGVYLHSLSLEDKNLRRINLSNANLSRMTLMNCDVSVADLKGTQIGFLSLEGTIIR
ncbi:MAG: pentapeptide repeat-containing protein [Aggregatilineales bacterium]